VNPGDFGWALERLRDGKRVARGGWNGRGMSIVLVRNCETNTLDYLQMQTVSGDTVPWLASQTDLLAADWYAVTA
jgi:hypothetical protein